MIVDILLSTYNGEKYLEEQIESIVGQSYADWHLICRDDGSRDHTIEILAKYKEKFPSKIDIITTEKNNLGSTKSFFYLLSKSTSECIFFCDQDDVWEKDKLEIFVNEYQKINDSEKPCLLFSSVTVVDAELNMKKDSTDSFNFNKGKNNNNIKWNVLENDVTGCAMMINKSLKDLCLSCETLDAIHHDWFLSLLATICDGKHYIKKETIFYRQHENNVVGARNKSFFIALKEVAQKKRKYPYYSQVNSILNTDIKINDDKVLNLLHEFSILNNKKKSQRIFWHIKNNFLRSGNLFIKIYQLLIC